MRLVDADALANLVERLSAEVFSEDDARLLKIIASGLRHDEKFAPTIEAEPVKHGRWIDAKKRTPNDEERSCAIVGIVNGNNGRINFDNGLIFVQYDTDAGAWWSADYDIEGCSVDYWLAIPNFNSNCGAKMDLEET